MPPININPNFLNYNINKQTCDHLLIKEIVTGSTTSHTCCGSVYFYNMASSCAKVVPKIHLLHLFYSFLLFRFFNTKHKVYLGLNVIYCFYYIDVFGLSMASKLWVAGSNPARITITFIRIQQL